MNTTNIRKIVSVAAAGALLLGIMPLAAMAATPVVTSMSPTSMVAGSGSFVLTVNGNNFTPTSVVKFNGIPRTTTYVSSNQVTTVLLASDVSMTGESAVSVENSAADGGGSNSLIFNASAVLITPELPNTGFGPEPAGVTTALVGLIALASMAVIGLSFRKVWHITQ